MGRFGVGVTDTAMLSPCSGAAHVLVSVVINASHFYVQKSWYSPVNQTGNKCLLLLQQMDDTGIRSNAG